jgi:flavodoxin
MERMDALVFCESVYGNTRAIAEAIAASLGGPPVRSTPEADDASAGVLVFAGPTRARGAELAASIEGATSRG